MLSFALNALNKFICGNKRRKCMQVGDIVIYTCDFDADQSEIPNVSASLVTKTHPNGNLDLCSFVSNGVFFKQNVAQGAVGVRGTWHPKPISPSVV
jgi:hypothetical protein